MNFFEFIECLGRIADNISLLPPRGKDPKKSVLIDLEEKRQWNLCDKLDALILYLYYKLGEQIKKATGTWEDQITEFDSSVIGLKKAKLRL